MLEIWQGGFKVEERKRYTRISVKDIAAAPHNGFYITSADTKAYAAFIGAVFAFFSALLLFGRRGRKG
jgi:hypothetical protein